MKICFIANADSVHSYRWIKYFSENRFLICWISLTPLKFDPLPGIKFHYLGINKENKYNIIRLVFMFKKIKKIIKDFDPDILHSHYAGMNGMIASLIDFHPFVLTAWGSDIIIAGRKKIFSFVVKHSLNKADIITCDAEHMRDKMIKMGIKANKIKIILFGTDIKVFSPGLKNKSILKKLSLDSEKIIISLRSLEKIYDVETLIRCIPTVLSKHPQAQFLICGNGSQFNYLKNLVYNQAVEKNVKFVGIIKNEELPEYLNISNVYVSTSLSDAGLSASTAEAMACGLPVIITDNSDNRNWIKNYKNGFIFPEKCENILAERIIYLLNNEELCSEYGNLNRTLIEKNNNYYLEMEKINSIYLDLINKFKYKRNVSNII